MHTIHQKLTMLSVVSVLLATAACSSAPKEAPKKETGSLTRTLEMVDEQNRHYGTVELNPIGGGKVLDATGNVIGEIVPPGHSHADYDGDHDD